MLTLTSALTVRLLATLRSARRSPGAWGLLAASSLALLAAAAPVPSTRPAAGAPRPSEAAGSASGELRHRRVTLPTGVALHVVEQGPPTGRPVVLLHGYSDSWQSFALVLPLLPSHWRVFALDLRGHGDSDRPLAAGYTTPDLAADVVAFLAAEGVTGATVVGHSMGSFVAQQVALLAPERVSQLVLVASAPSLASLVGGAEFAAVVATLEDPVPADFIREFQLSAVHRPLPPAFFADALAASARLPARVWRAVLAGMPTAGSEADLSQVAAPTLLVWGEHDAMFGRAAQDELLARIPGSQLLAYAEVGHSPHWEEPERFTRDLVRFVDAPLRPASRVAGDEMQRPAPREVWDSGFDG